MAMRRWTVAALAALSLAAGVGKASAQSVTVKGTVRDSATKQLVAGAIVTLGTSQRILSARTDEVGEFTIRGVNPDRATIAVRRIGYRQQEWSVEVREDTTIALVVTPNATRLAPVRVGAKGEGVWGTIVRASDLKPVAGAEVRIAGSGIRVLTDSVGEYFVPLKRPGTFLVRVTHKGFAEDILSVKVKRDEVVESSHLLEASDRAPTPPGLWADFDKRLRWAPTNNSALVTGADLRAIGGSTADGLRASPEIIKTGLRFGLPDPGLCVFLNGTPRPGMSINDIRPEEIRAVEIYSDIAKDQMVIELDKMWPRGTSCGSSPAFGAPRGRGRASPPGVKWAVVWTR